MTVRLEFSKRGPVRYISHRDVARAWERAFRRARLPLSFTQGFSPHPQVSFGLALPTGYESDAEYLDVGLSTGLEPEDVRSRLNAVLPEGMAVERASSVPRHTPSVASITEWADYTVAVSGPSEDPPPPAETVAAALSALFSVPVWTAPRRRKGREVADETEDLRPMVGSVDLCDPVPEGFGPLTLRMRLATRPRVVRPDEVCQLLSTHYPEAACEPRRVRRIAQLCVGGDPLAATASSTKEVLSPDAQIPPPR